MFHVESPTHYSLRENSTFKHIYFSGGLPLHQEFKANSAKIMDSNSSIEKSLDHERTESEGKYEEEHSKLNVTRLANKGWDDTVSSWSSKKDTTSSKNGTNEPSVNAKNEKEAAKLASSYVD